MLSVVEAAKGDDAFLQYPVTRDPMSNCARESEHHARTSPVISLKRNFGGDILWVCQF